jgi:hypothetical protein
MSGKTPDPAHTKLMGNLEEIKRLKGDFAFTMSFANENEGTLGNQNACNVEPTCEPPGA